MNDEPQPKATPEQAKHLLKELKTLAEGGHIKMTEFALVRDLDKSQTAESMCREGKRLSSIFNSKEPSTGESQCILYANCGNPVSRQPPR